MVFSTHAKLQPTLISVKGVCTVHLPAYVDRLGHIHESGFQYALEFTNATSNLIHHEHLHKTIP